MANPQVEDGYTKIANDIMDALCRTRIPGEERQILDCIFRKTYGWNKTEDAISLSQFVEMTGINKPHIIQAIKGLLLKKVISVTKKGNAPTKVYKINKDFEQWNPLPKKVTLPKKVISVTEKGNSSLPKKVPTKDTTTKDTITKDSIYIPACISKESWEAFFDMRTEIKEPLTRKAADLIIKKLLKIRDGTGQDPDEILEESVMNRWKGVFAIKGGNNGNGTGRNGSSTGATFGKTETKRSFGDGNPYPIDDIITE